MKARSPMHAGLWTVYTPMTQAAGRLVEHLHSLKAGHPLAEIMGSNELDGDCYKSLPKLMS
jgi:hypothetical protein